jgi:fibronectin type 3 domain-containing protein
MKVLKRTIKMLDRMKKGTVLATIMFLFSVSSYANVVKLAWDKNTESDVAGYNVYRSTLPGVFGAKLNAVLIPHPATVGPVLYTDTTPLNTTYYYVVRAVNQAMLESLNSNQVTANPLPPGAPGNLTITGLTTVNLFVDSTKVAVSPIQTPLRYTLIVPRQTPPRDVQRQLQVTVE